MQPSMRLSTQPKTTKAGGTTELATNGHANLLITERIGIKIDKKPDWWWERKTLPVCNAFAATGMSRYSP